MKNVLTSAVAALSLVSGVVQAAPIESGSGWISSDRFGYEGTITVYSDAGLANQVDLINVSERDLSLYSIFGNPGVGADAAIAMGSWWYSTAVDGTGAPRGNGWGNTHGNTGAGFMQYYNAASYSDPAALQDVSFGFDNFNGTHWTDFLFSMSVRNGDSASRLSAPSNVADAGTFLELDIDLHATGLEGLQIGNMIEANGDPLGVTGSMSGLFLGSETQNGQTNDGLYYVFDFDLNMDNWAYANRDDLVGIEYASSTFAVNVSQVPEPGVLGLFGLSLIGLAIRRRKSA
ncbi:PEP-CTERM sorting domain-containing protein [Alteromonas halophila]|uniref:Ice-binding protein C-terminal domain-containing protein n=1 Tax=Alteromonas halophila TaxID=516698 RepID=A0A918JMR3_9ALTE|nr:PEP-CTERM sorting domain-containing protein [Alteromonas halophila]GGW90661.1 hypothetical protein GCM10007391_26140 [Alteromonas halophila]